MEKLAVFSNRLHHERRHYPETEPLVPSCSQKVTTIFSNRFHLDHSKFFRRKPKTKEITSHPSNLLQTAAHVENEGSLCQVAIPVDKPHAVARVKSKDELYREVLLIYKIEPTRWERGYPHVGLDVKCPGYRIDEQFSERLRSLLTDIIIHAQAFDISFPSSLPNPDQLDPIFLNECLDAYVGELFPALKGVSLNTPSPYCNSFEDDEILHITSDLFSDSRMDIGINQPPLEKPVFASFSGEGSLGPTTAILLYELQVSQKVYKRFYKVRDLGVLETKLAENGLQLTRRNYTKIDQLRDCVSSQPAIVFVNSFKNPPHPFTDIPHCVLVDEVTAEQANRQYQVRIRDPYHKWTATIDGKAFSRCWLSNKPVLTIQLMKHFQPITPA